MRGWLSIVAVCGLGAAAGGEVVTFINTGAIFNWRPLVGVSFPPPLDLDVTQPPTQPGTHPASRGVYWARGVLQSSSHGLPHVTYCNAEVRLARSLTPVSVPLNNGRNTDLFPPLAVAAGGTVGPALNWQDRADLG